MDACRALKTMSDQDATGRPAGGNTPRHPYVTGSRIHKPEFDRARDAADAWTGQEGGLDHWALLDLLEADGVAARFGLKTRHTDYVRASFKKLCREDFEPGDWPPHRLDDQGETREEGARQQPSACLRNRERPCACRLHLLDRHGQPAPRRRTQQTRWPHQMGLRRGLLAVRRNGPGDRGHRPPGRGGADRAKGPHPRDRHHPLPHPHPPAGSTSQPTRPCRGDPPAARPGARPAGRQGDAVCRRACPSFPCRGRAPFQGPRARADRTPADRIRGGARAGNRGLRSRVPGRRERC